MYISISYRYYYILIVIQGICILVSDMCIFRLGVYEVYCIPCYILFVYFFVGSGVGGLCTQYLYTWFYFVWEVIDYILGLCTQKYLEFSRLQVFFLFIFCGVGRGILDLLGSEVYPVGMGLSLGCYTGLGTQRWYPLVHLLEYHRGYCILSL